MNQTVLVSSGAIEYSFPLTLSEVDGKNITGDVVQVSLGSYDAPGTWGAPDIISRPSPSTAVVQKLINSAVTPGVYWLWCRVTDSPEVVPRRGNRITVT